MRLESWAARLKILMEIHFVSGKGGVGKSVVAASLARRKTLQGRRTLLIELGEQSGFQRLFPQLQIGHKPSVLPELFDLALWNGLSCFQEYARHLLRLESLYKIIFENQVAVSLLNAAPGLAELSILGKITSGLRKVGPDLPYDVLVVDAYSSGHFLSLIKAPFGFAEAISVGPMGEETRGIIQVLKDPQQTTYWLVTQGEEMMVAEAEELCRELQKWTGMAPNLILNKCLSRPEGAPPEDLFGKSLSDYFQELLQAEERLRRINPPRRAPWIFNVDPLAVAQLLDWDMT
jgi:anion-transporting  ArsA/GET3 family ATPase